MATEPSVPSAGRGHPRSRHWFLTAAASLAAVIMLAAGAGFGTYVWARSKVHYIGAPSPATSNGTPVPPGFDEKCAKQSCNYLLLGSDSRAGLSKAQQEDFGTNKDIGGSNRADTIVVVHTEPGQQKAVILSFPRDLWVDVPGHGYGKINSAFEGGINGGGADLVARTIKQLTGLQINHVMYVDLAGFEGVVNALGGVDMCIPTAMSDPLTGLNIKAGCQHFDGSTALAFVRTRHQPCDTIPDFARIARQQQFLRAVLAKLLSPGEILHLPSLVPAVLDHLRVDRGLNPVELAYLASQLNGINTGAADFRVVPTTTGSITVNGVYFSIVKLVQPQAGDLFRRLRSGQPLGDLGTVQQGTAPSPATIQLGVFDKTSGGKAATVLSILQQSGFDVPPTIADSGTLASPVKGSVILFKHGQKAQADVAATYVPNVKEVEAPKGLLGDLDVAVVIASKFQPQSPGTGGAPSPCP